MMKLMYFQDPRGNFGDELNPWLWSRLFGDHISAIGNHGEQRPGQQGAGYGAGDLLFYGIGTILDDRIPELPDKIIFGSGFGYGRKPDNLAHCKLFFVRGSKTAEVLGLPADKALTDPAILLRHFFPLVPARDRRHPVSFMPHHTTTAGDYWQRACTALDIHYIDPLGFDIETVVRDISASSLLITEAMHGAIVADTFRVPWIPVSSVSETNPFKWQDWCGTLDLVYAPVSMTPIFPSPNQSPVKAALNRIKLAVREMELGALTMKKRTAVLSDEKLLNRHLRTMDAKVAELDSYLNRRRAGGG